MKKNIFATLTIIITFLFLSSNMSVATEEKNNQKDSSNYFKENSSIRFGAGINYYSTKEKDGNSDNGILPVVSVGYKLNIWKGLFIDTNLILDIAKLKSAFEYSDLEFCDAEDVAEGECSAVGSYRTFSSQKIDSYRFFDFNIGYQFNYGISIFAGLNFYQVNEKYKYTKYSTISNGSKPFGNDSMDDEDSIKLGFGLGLGYKIPTTNFGIKFAYNMLSFDGGYIYEAGKQKVTDNRFLFSIIYDLNLN